MGSLWRDVRYGLRMLARDPGFTAITVMTLALGIGACTVVFSAVNGMVLKPLGYLPARRATKVDPMVALRCE